MVKFEGGDKMTTATVAVLVGGFLSALMTLFHLRFPQLFQWKANLHRLREIDKRVLHTIHTALYLLFVLFAVLAFLYTSELARSAGLANGLCIGYSLFWLWRTIRQIVFFRFRIFGENPATQPSVAPGPMHIVLILVFALLAISWGIPPVLRFIA